jgi:hypothetical protein
MSLLDGPIPAHAPVLKRFEANFRKESRRAGGEEVGAVLLNLIEEDRVHPGGRATFQAKLATSKRRAWKDRFKEAVGSLPRHLPLPTPRPPAVCGTWWYTHLTLKALQSKGYLSRALTAARPPRRVPLARLLGRAATGEEHATWITNATSANADDLRDRLGLGFIGQGEELYRVRFAVESAPGRILYIPTALDAGWYPAWRRPHPSHADPWGMTRHLATDLPSAPELLALPDLADEQAARHVGPIRTAPPRGFLASRRLP